jgi:hypothetical protein
MGGSKTMLMDGSMHFEEGLQIEREGDTLIVRSAHTAEWLGVLFGIFTLLWIIAWTVNFTQGEPGYWIGPLIGVAFAGAGVFLMLPRVVTTIFDLQSRRVKYNLSIGNRWYERSCNYSFVEILGVGVKAYYHEGYSYLPAIALKNGKRL